LSRDDLNARVLKGVRNVQDGYGTRIGALEDKVFGDGTNRAPARVASPAGRQPGGAPKPGPGRPATLKAVLRVAAGVAARRGGAANPIHARSKAGAQGRGIKLGGRLADEGISFASKVGANFNPGTAANGRASFANLQVILAGENASGHRASLGVYVIMRRSRCHERHRVLPVLFGDRCIHDHLGRKNPGSGKVRRP
jgi:hypothetical protein